MPRSIPRICSPHRVAASARHVLRHPSGLEPRQNELENKNAGSKTAPRFGAVFIYGKGRGWLSGAAVVAMIELVDPDLAAQRITMDAQQARGAGLISIRAIQHALDEFFLKFVHCFFKQNASLDHL